MPWKQEKDPYKIWISEVILQQTRVDQGLHYYNRFISAYPGVHDLAKAPEQEIFKLWEGLGYYNRCKSLITTAKRISGQMEGRFPDNYDDIRSLKGIGPYTAAAIASFAFNLPYAVVDGNVIRVLSRYFGISTPSSSSDGKNLYTQLAAGLLDKKQPGIFNQAIMDFGAVICKPRLPLCPICVQKKDCQALKHGWVNDLPVKDKSAKRKTRWFYYFLIEYNNRFYVRKRSRSDIWENLYEFVLKENDKPLPCNDAAAMQMELEDIVGNKQIELKQISKEYRQHLTHQTIAGRFIMAKTTEPAAIPGGYEALPGKDLIRYPFPKFINAYLSDILFVEGDSSAFIDRPS